MRKFKVYLDPKTLVVVNEHQIYKERWITYFGSIEKVEEFIKNYKG
jgi:hypothetical protein